MNNIIIIKALKDYKRAQDIRAYIQIMKQRKKDKKNTIAARKDGTK